MKYLFILTLALLPFSAYANLHPQGPECPTGNSSNASGCPSGSVVTGTPNYPGDFIASVCDLRYSVVVLKQDRTMEIVCVKK